jgi:hypothetical protein
MGRMDERVGGLKKEGKREGRREGGVKEEKEE